ncbi:MAG: acyl-CoA dehydrogenase family protein [Acidimicrobiales bacterium]
MDLRLTAEQQQLVDTFSSLYAREAGSAQVRAAEPLGFDKSLWEHLGDLGVTTMAVDEARGGWGASLLDLALVAEQQGRHVAPAPVIEAQVAARLLTTLGGALDDRLVTVALHPGVDGRARLVPAAAVADLALVPVGDALVVAEVGDGNRTLVDNLGSMPVADIVIGAARSLGGPEAVEAWDAALDEFAVLTSAALVGMASAALEVTTAYVKEREAWNQPIGSFQSVAHRLADVATAVDGARLLAYEAAWAAAEEPDRFAELASLAFAFSSETARDATYWAVHLHGGYGFMLEYDVQLFYRRARAWSRVLWSPAVAYRRAADRRYVDS